MIILFSKLLVAHLIGDFILLRDREGNEKVKSLWKSKRLSLHAIVHFILALFAIYDITYWWLALAVGVSHYLVELVVSILLQDKPRWKFVIDQIVHLLLIGVVAVAIAEPSFTLDINLPWTIIAGIIAVTFPAAKFIEVFLTQWPPTKSAEKIKGLVNAGLWIGILERILIYIFIVTSHWEGIGFLLAAKSVFRFGDLTNSKDISLTEYIMVGTFLSFCLAIAAGLITNYFLI